jgi:membrane protease YdiL (CAAX protease family)
LPTDESPSNEPASNEPEEQVGVEAPEAFPVRVRRIPNLGHALLFVSFTGLLLMLFQLGLSLAGKAPAAVRNGEVVLVHPMLQLVALGGTYLLGLAAAWLFYPAVWHRRFLDGIEWNWATARGQAAKLIALGFLLGMMVQVVTYFITPAKTLPIDEFFSTAADAWVITFFGSIVAPVFEEICFRGFLVPAFATAYDWLSLPRTEEARTRWQTTTAVTPAALFFSAVLTSVCFAMLHAQQVAHVWAALLVLFSVSLVLTFVRVKMRSVAASALVHGAYNFLIFFLVMVCTGGFRHLERMTK